MIDTIYIEDEVRNHPRTRSILERYKGADIVSCERYTEIFNRRSQNFRIQKKNPALIIARKHGAKVLPTPEGYGVGGKNNFYFSHMLNCLYDCRYCFLQGMYRSANYVWFVNYEDFGDEILKAVKQNQGSGEDSYFFSGYDCDSLAMEDLTGFVDWAIPFFSQVQGAYLELRTKSVNLKALKKHAPMEHCIVAFSLTPDAVAKKVEHGAPKVESRIKAMSQLIELGWKVGIRFDPLIQHPNFEASYEGLFRDVFGALPADRIHSVSFGPMRFPKTMYDRILKLYPKEKMLHAPMENYDGMISYGREKEVAIINHCQKALGEHIDTTKFFRCMPGEMP
ncbi:MAG: DNA photolyase [Myxococcota bacterium]|nr:DNA photolyase [Myxococcota bacterium]